MIALFLDTNILIYLLDETDPNHLHTITILEETLNDNRKVLISHLIMQEFVHVRYKIGLLTKEKALKENLKKHITQIFSIPRLSFISPTNDLEFVARVIEIMIESSIESTDAYTITLIEKQTEVMLFTFDKKLQRAAKEHGIHVIPNV